jgi:hypothetical protein
MITSNTVEDFIDHWERSLDFSSIPAIRKELNEAEFKEKIQACANSIFEKSVEISNQNPMDHTLQYLQIKADKLNQLAQKLIQKTEQGQDLTNGEEFLALSNLALCGDTFAKIKWRKDDLVEGLGKIQNLEKILELLKTLNINSNSIRSVNLKIKELLSLIGEENNMESIIIFCYLEALEVPQIILEHVAFHSEFFSKALFHLGSEFLKKSLNLENGNFRVKYSALTRTYISEILTSKCEGSYILRKSSYPNFGKYITIAVSGMVNSKITHKLLFYNKEDGTWCSCTKVFDVYKENKETIDKIMSPYKSLEAALLSWNLNLPVRLQAENVSNFLSHYDPDL